MATSESEAHIESNLRTSTKATFTYQYIHQKLFNYKEVVEVVDRRDTDKRKVPKYARILKIGSSNFFFQTRPPFSQLTEQSIFFNEKNLSLLKKCLSYGRILDATSLPLPLVTNFKYYTIKFPLKGFLKRVSSNQIMSIQTTLRSDLQTSTCIFTLL